MQLKASFIQSRTPLDAILAVTALVSLVGFASCNPDRASVTDLRHISATTLSVQWPNEPVGWTTLNDWGFDQAPPQVPKDTTIDGSPGPWHIVFNNKTDPAVLPGGTDSTGEVTLVSDPTAPLSPPNTYMFRYPVRFPGGEAPATPYGGLPTMSSMYIGFWWKPSNPWQGHPSNFNKILFVFTAGSHDFYIAMYGPPGGPYATILQDQGGFNGSPTQNYVENVGSSSPLALGTWHQIEILWNSPANTIKWFVDGQLRGDYNVTITLAPTELKLSPTWGGVDGNKTEEDYYWFDHIHISHP
jgi:hypothetical protein